MQSSIYNDKKIEEVDMKIQILEEKIKEYPEENFQKK